MKTLKTHICASAIALMVAAPAAFADGHSQMVDQVTTQMLDLNVEPAGFEYLTPQELAEIKVIIESDEENFAKIERIEEVIATRQATAGADAQDGDSVAIAVVGNELRDQVQNYLIENGYDADASTLSAQQVAEIKAVMETEDLSDEDEKGRIDAALAM